MLKSGLLLSLLMTASIATGSSDNISIINGMLDQARPQSVKIVNTLGRPVDLEATLTRLEMLKAGEKKRITGTGFVSPVDGKSMPSVWVRNYAASARSVSLLEKIKLRVNPGDSLEVSVDQWDSFVSGLRHLTDDAFLHNITSNGGISVELVGAANHSLLALGYEEIDSFDPSLYSRILRDNPATCWRYFTSYRPNIAVNDDFQINFNHNLLIVDIDGFLTKFPRREDYLSLRKELGLEDLRVSNISWLVDTINRKENTVVFSSAYENDDRRGPYETLEFIIKILSLCGKNFSADLTFPLSNKLTRHFTFLLVFIFNHFLHNLTLYLYPKSSLCQI